MNHTTRPSNRTTRAVAAAAAAAATIAAAACSSGATRTVSVRITDDAGQPVPDALVVLINLGTNDAVLPVSGLALAENAARGTAATATTQIAVTNQQGVASLNAFAPRRHHEIRVLHPPNATHNGRPTPNTAGVWRIDAAAGTINTTPSHPNPPGLHADIVR